MGKKSRLKKEAAEVKSPQSSKPKHYFKLTTKELLWLLPIVILTIICFLPALDAEFVNWDDDRNFYENALITSLNNENFWSNCKQIFTTPVIGNYNPLPILTFAFEKAAFGFEKPFFWHLDNLLLHLLCVVFVYIIGLRMKLSTLAAVVLAGLFAIHPMRVESVAWVTERKDVLFGLFYLWAMLLYIKNKQEGSTWVRQLGILLLFTLSLFSKIQAVILPISFILLDYWFADKITLKQIFSKTHLFGMSLLFGLLGIYFLKDQGSLESTSDYSLFQRVFVGSYSYLLYYVKAIVPFRLSPLYPYPKEMPVYFYPSILSFVAAAGLLVYSYMKHWKVWFFGLGFFTANIFFLLQILGAGQGFVADRFTYIAYFGLFFIAAYYIDRIPSTISTNVKYAALAIPMLIYGGITYNQTKVWQNSGTLWTHVLKYYTNVTLPYGNRANYHRDKGMVKEALADYASSIALDPNQAGPYNSRARLYFDSQKAEDLPSALAEYNKAIELEPNEPEYFANRGATHARMGNLDAALQDLNKSIEIDPNFENSYLNRSVIYNQLGDVDNALLDIQTYLKFRPYMPDLWYESGRLKNLKNMYAEAVLDLDKAIKYNPNKGVYYIERGKALFSTGQYAKAKIDIQNAKAKGSEVPSNVWETIMNYQ